MTLHPSAAPARAPKSGTARPSYHWKSKSRRRRQVHALRDAFPFIAIKAALFIVFVFVPFVYTFYLTFQRGSLLSGLSFVGLNNYRTIISDTLFWQTLRNTGLFMIVLIPLTVLVGLGLGLLLTARVRGISIYRTLIYLPALLSVVVTGVVWKVMVDTQTGPVNALFSRGLGINVPWLTSGTFTIIFLSLVTLWSSSGFYALIFMSGFNDIPDDLLDAGRIDGANTWQLLVHIKLPMIRPVMQIVLVLATINAVQVFDLVYVMTQGGPGTATYTAMWYVYQNAFNGGSVAYAATMSVVLLIITAGISAVFVVRRGKGATQS